MRECERAAREHRESGWTRVVGKAAKRTKIFFSQQTDTHDSLVEKVVESLNFNSSTKFNEKKSKSANFVEEN